MPNVKIMLQARSPPSKVLFFSLLFLLLFVCFFKFFHSTNILPFFMSQLFSLHSSLPPPFLVPHQNREQMWLGTYASLMLNCSLIHQTSPSCSVMTGLRAGLALSLHPQISSFLYRLSVCACMHSYQRVRLDLGNDILVSIS